MPAARWRRVVARLVDTAIAAVVGVLSHALGGPGLSLALAVATALDVVPVARTGSSPGRWLVGIRVVGPDGLAPGWARAWLRHAALSPLLVGSVGGAHNRVALTAVVRGPTQPVLPVPGPLPRPFAAGGEVAVAVWAGVWVATVVAMAAAALGSDLSTGAFFGLLLPAQTVGALSVVAVTARVKGTGSWRDDFGWELRLRDAPYAFLGPLLLFAMGLVLAPFLHWLGVDPEQEVTEEIGRAVSAPQALAAVLTVAVLAPIEEELLFRGILLRSLLRRHPVAKAMVLDGIVFAVVHLLDPGVWPVLPGLAFLGWFLARLTVRSGSISKAVFVHGGYNLVIVALNLAA
jgi:membrane protease YdiL (CAAX protease family)